MTVQDIAREEVVTVDPETPVEDIAASMHAEQVGSVVVVEGNEPIGMVTDRDIGIGIWEFDEPTAVTAEELMAADPVTVEASADIYSALRTAREAGVRRLPVTDDGTLVGIVTLDDVIVLLAGELNEASAIIQSHSPPY